MKRKLIAVMVAAQMLVTLCPAGTVMAAEAESTQAVEEENDQAAGAENTQAVEEENDQAAGAENTQACLLYTSSTQRNSAMYFL